MSAFVRDAEDGYQWIAPTSPFTGAELLARLLDVLGRGSGCRMTINQVARIVGCSRSTAEYWVGVACKPRVQAFISLLERMFDEGRFRFLREVCRTLPTIFEPQEHIGSLALLGNHVAICSGLTIVVSPVNCDFLDIDPGSPHRKICGYSVFLNFEIERLKLWQ